MVATGTENVGVNAQTRVAMLEFDCATGGDSGSSSYVLIPASENPNGLIILACFGILTEVMAGSSEDQGVVTISDESDNALDTLTPSDAAADALGDYITGASIPEPLYVGGSTGTAWAGKMVAAGEFVDAAVTQLTVGTPAGRYLVCVLYVPVPSAPK
jgi:hypothetical protein